jgi:hypothetical protein
MPCGTARDLWFLDAPALSCSPLGLYCHCLRAFLFIRKRNLSRPLVSQFLPRLSPWCPYPLITTDTHTSELICHVSVSGGTVGTCCRDLVFHTPCSAMDNFYVFADLSWTSRSHCTYPPPKIVSSRSIETQGGGISQVLPLSRTVISNT